MNGEKHGRQFPVPLMLHRKPSPVPANESAVVMWAAFYRGVSMTFHSAIYTIPFPIEPRISPARLSLFRKCLIDGKSHMKGQFQI